jgi:hypothetical protein
VEQAAIAFRSTLEMRSRRGVEGIRKELLSSASQVGVAEHEFDVPWPYLLPRFKALVDGPWGGNIPAIPHGVDEQGNLLMLNNLVLFNWTSIISDGLEDLYVELSLWCDVWVDLCLHHLSCQQARVVGRHDLVGGVSRRKSNG